MPILTKHPETLQLNYSVENNRVDKSIQNYIAKLEKKVIIQSKKLSELEKYKYKCEQFIKRINPYQILPITDEMLSDDYEIIKDPINAAEQQNYDDLLKKTIENELIKNGLLNHNVNAEEVIDLAKIKLESKEYKKQLVLAHSMINSLKSDLIELTKENEEYKMNKDKLININNNESINMNNNQIFDINQKLIKYKENFEKINQDFEKLMEEKKQIKKENNKLKKEIMQYKEQTIKLNEEFRNNIIKDNNVNNILIEKEKNELLLENENLKERIDNILKDKLELEKENKSNQNKLIELNKKYKIEKDKLQKEIKKLIIENKTKKEKEFNKDNFNYFIEDTEEENIKMKTIPLNQNNNEKKDLLNLQQKFDDLNIQYSILNKKYESLLDKYGKNLKEKDKIQEIFNKRNLYKNKTINEIKNLLEKSLELNDKNNDDININNKKDSFDYNKIKYMLWEMDNELNEKNKIILENKNNKNDLENEIENKFKYYDEYIMNNKSKIKNLLNQLLNLLILFKEKYDSLYENNKSINYISNQFLVDTDKIINQINTINNITNYDIELDDNIFFETINNFLSLLSQEVVLIYNKTYKYKKYNFHHRSKSELSKNDYDLFSKNKYRKEEYLEIIKEINELKKQNNLYIKENLDLKNKIIELNNNLNEIMLKYNFNKKSVSTSNEGKKHLLNLMFKFIKNIKDNDFAKIIYDILTLSEQINLTQINKCLVQEKLNIIMKNNQDLSDEYSSNIEEYLLNEINKLKKLLEDYDIQIAEKKETLQKLNEEYLIKEEQYSKNIKNIKDKNNSFIKENDEELNNKLSSSENEMKEISENK